MENGLAHLLNINQASQNELIKKAGDSVHPLCITTTNHKLFSG